jgi:hypothetical protein
MENKQRTKQWKWDFSGQLKNFSHQHLLNELVSQRMGKFSTAENFSRLKRNITKEIE